MSRARVLTVVGARPQFVKAAPVSAALAARGLDEILVHTGQHFDDNMSRVFFEEMGIPRPAHDLGLGGGTHGAMTGRMTEAVEALILAERPDAVLVYGDTNSTLAGALAAVKLHVPVAHVEAGLRSFNRRMPEELNRVLTDHAANILFCPTQTAVDNLAAEGIADRGPGDPQARPFDRPVRVLLTGDVMYDAVLRFSGQVRAEGRGERLRRELGLTGDYALCTVHRAENTDDPARLAAIFAALAGLAADLPVVVPLHPRTRGRLAAQGVAAGAPGLRLVEPVGFLDMMALLLGCRLVLTDSGGLQKEACFLQKPCVTMRDETEWVETVQQGWNVLAGADRERILTAARAACGDADASARPPLQGYGAGDAAGRIAGTLCDYLL